MNISDDTILIVAGAIGAILGAVDVYRSSGQNLAAWAAVVIGIGLALVGLNNPA